ncbi:MAG: hypothetical protein ACRCYQ_06680 [Nocardioides sp.]
MSKQLTRVAAGVSAALLLALGMAVGVVAPAYAHHNSITVVAECDVYEPGSWVITWSVTNSEDDKYETVTASSRPDVLPVGTEIGPGATIEAKESATAAEDLTLEITTEWDNGVVATDSGTLSAGEYPDCSVPGPVNEISATADCGEEPDTWVITWSVTNTTDQNEKIVESSRPDVVPVDTEIAAGDTVLVEETVTVREDTMVELTFEWADGQRSTEEYTVPKDDLSPDCEGKVADQPEVASVDECGTADDSVTLSTSDTYTGVDNGDGTATFTAADGYVFESDGENVTELTLTYEVPSDEACPAKPTALEVTPATCDDGGSLTIPDQPEGVVVTPQPGTYGPGTYDVEFEAEEGYELTADRSRRVVVEEMPTEECAAPPSNPAPPAEPDLPATGSPAGLLQAGLVGLSAVLVGLGTIAYAARRRRRATV